MCKIVSLSVNFNLEKRVSNETEKITCGIGSMMCHAQNDSNQVESHLHL